jgi:phage baseplate assembly protein W
MRVPVTSIRYPVGIDASLGAFDVESDYARHVDQMMRQVLLTNPGERINRPTFGCGVRRMLFAPNSDVAATLAQITIYQAIDEWLGAFVRVDDVKVRADGERLEIRVSYVLRARQERRYINLEVTL